jgi:hypothetical protein
MRAAGGDLAPTLIVEDSPDNMKLFRVLLTLEGHEIAVCRARTASRCWKRSGIRTNGAGGSLR